MTPTYTNRTISLHRTTPRTDRAENRWFHTVPPPGEYAGGTIKNRGKEIKNATIIITDQDLTNIVAAFRADQAAAGTAWRGLLVDREHYSLDLTKPSDAMAWAFDIRVEPTGIWTRWRFTAPGRRLWHNEILVNRSPVLELSLIPGTRTHFRPTRLSSIAMTNTPHFDLSTLAAARAADVQTTNQGDPNMDKILALLGLPETATEDEALAAVQSLIDSLAAVQAEKATADEQLEEAQEELEEVKEELEESIAIARKHRADAFIAANRDTIKDVSAFRKAYLLAPDATEAALSALRPAAATVPPRISARTAATPATSTTGATTPTVTLAAYRAMPPGSEKDAYLAQHAATLLRLEREEAARA